MSETVFDPGAEALARDWYAQGRHDAAQACGDVTETVTHDVTETPPRA